MPFAETIHPTEIIPETIVASSAASGWNGLIVERSVMPPMEKKLPPPTQNMILFHFGSRIVKRQPQQISRFAGRAFEGELQHGDIIIQPAGIESFHSWTTADDCLILTVEQEFLRRVGEEVCEANPMRVELLPVPRMRDERIAQIALTAHGELENDNLGGKLFGDSLANLLALHLLRAHAVFEMQPRAFKGGLAKHKLRRVIEYINANLSADLSLDALAREAGMSSYHFARMFKNATGLAPHQFVVRQRIERAKQLLREDKFTVAEIAFSLGFADQSHFTKNFRRVVGTTPAMYNKKL